MTKKEKSDLPEIDYVQPTPEAVRALRDEFGLSQHEAAQLVDVAVTYKEINGYPNPQSATWQRYESLASKSARSMPGLVWTMFQLVLGRHPKYKLVRRKN